VFFENNTIIAVLAATTHFLSRTISPFLQLDNRFLPLRHILSLVQQLPVYLGET
jgi:hypothetical protein